MHEVTRYTPEEIKTILQTAHCPSNYEKIKADPVLLAVSFLLEVGVHADHILGALNELNYGQTTLLEGSKYKYKRLRTRLGVLVD